MRTPLSFSATQTIVLAMKQFERRIRPVDNSSAICRSTSSLNIAGTRYGRTWRGTNSDVVWIRCVITSHRPGLSTKQSVNSSSSWHSCVRWETHRWVSLSWSTLWLGNTLDTIGTGVNTWRNSVSFSAITPHHWIRATNWRILLANFALSADVCVKAGGGNLEHTLKWTTCQILISVITVNVSWQWKLQVAVDYSAQNWKYGIDYSVFIQS